LGVYFLLFFLLFFEWGACVRRRGTCAMAQWHNGQSKWVCFLWVSRYG